MVSVWWSSAGVNHYDFIKPVSLITAEIYCNQLDKMIQKLKEKQPKLVNKSTFILLLDNARQHNAKMTGKTTGVVLFHHPPYSPDLAPIDKHSHN